MMNLFVFLAGMLMELFTTIGCFVGIAAAGIIIGSPIMLIALFAIKCEEEGGVKTYFKKLLKREAVK